MTNRTRMCAAVAAAAAATLIVTACSSNPSDDAADSVTEVRFGHLYELPHPFHQCGAQPFADAINGLDLGLNVTIYPAGQLGNEQELVQSIASGDLDIAFGSPGAVANWYAPIGVLDAAYVVDDWDHLKRVWGSDIGDEFRAGLEESGIVPLDLWLYGSRHLTTSSKPIHSPEDLSGLKIRAIDTPISLANASAMGSSPVPVAFDELYLALSQGVVDGQENPIPTIDSLKIFEVQGYLNLTGHLLQSAVMLASTDFFNTLDDEQQTAVLEEMAAAGESMRECVEQIERDRIAEWEESGVWAEIVYPEDIDLDAFRERAASELPAQFGETWGDLYERIRAMAE